MEKLSRALGAGVPAEAVNCYARWWQLETYVREIVYTELRAKFGGQWPQELDPAVLGRAKGDRINHYMASADAEDLLSYADASVLFDTIDQHWELFADVLLPPLRWQGQVDTLKAVRNRIAHCRRPHPDDLARIEMTLRDLEAGARRFYSSYTDTSHELKGRRDPVVKAWIGQRHEAAARLIDHCERNYETRFRLVYSLRPWAREPAEKAPISGHEGAIWHAKWLTGGREINAQRLWKELQPRTQESILHLLIEVGGVSATFAATEAAGEVADAIGDTFDTLIETSREFVPSGGMEAVELEIKQTRRSVGRLPAKVQYQSALSLFDPLNPEAFSLFGVTAGA